MCEHTVLRFSISLRETFPVSIVFTVINKYGYFAVFQISKSAWVRLPCCFSKGPRKQDFLDN